MAELKITKVGGSLKITLPKQVCDLLGWGVEDKVKIKVVEGNNLLVLNLSLEEEKDGKGKKDFFR